LINFLKRNGVSWKTEKDTEISIKKESNIITVADSKYSFSLILDREKMEAVLRVSRFRTFSFVAKQVRGRICLYNDFESKLGELKDLLYENRKKLEKTIGAIHKLEYLNTEFGHPLRYEILFTHDWVGILFLYLLHVREDNCYNIASNFEKAISEGKFVPPEERGKAREDWKKKYTMDSLYKILEEYLEYMSAEGFILSRQDLAVSSSQILYRLHSEFFYSGNRILTTSKIQRTKKYPTPIAIYTKERENKEEKGSAKADYSVKSNIINRNISLVLLELIAKATNAWQERWTKQNQNKIMTIIENIGNLNDYSYSAILIYTWAAMLPLLSLLQSYRCNKGIIYGYFKPEIADIAEAVGYYQGYKNTRYHETCTDSSSIPLIKCRKKTLENIDEIISKQTIYDIKPPQKDGNWNITDFSLINELKDIILDLIEKTELSLFSWDKIPGEHNDKLREILLKDYSIDLSKESRIEKINDGQIIYVPDDNPIRLERRQTKAILKIGERRVDEFIVRREEDGWNIYKKLDINKDYPECFYKNKDIDLLKAIEGLTEQSDMIRSILMFNFADSAGVLGIRDFFAPSSSIYEMPK
jgi:hypothetical protein